jgi:hypothetical protein
MTTFCLHQTWRANCVAFKSTSANYIRLTMNIKAILFVEVSSHTHAMKFKLHVHLLLIEQKLHDSHNMVVDAILQWLQHFGPTKVWKVFARHCKVHGKDMGSPS